MYFCRLKQFFGEVITYFLTNPSFQIVESEFLFSANSILLFTAFRSFVRKPFLALISVPTSWNEGFS